MAQEPLLELEDLVRIDTEDGSELGTIKMMIGYPPRDIYVEIIGPGALGGYHYVHLPNEDGSNDANTLNMYNVTQCTKIGN